MNSRGSHAARCVGWFLSARSALRQHLDHLIGTPYVSKDALHGLEFRFVRVAMDFGHGVTDDDHPVVVFHTFADRSGHADARGDARKDAGVHPEVPQDRIERRVRKAAKALLDNQVPSTMKVRSPLVEPFVARQYGNAASE